MSINSFGNGNIRRERVLFIALTFIIVFAIFISYLFSLQIVRWSEYMDKASSVSKRTTEIPPLRGEIYDRNYDSPLATNMDSFEISITPAECDKKELPGMISKLAGILETDSQLLLKKIPVSGFYQSVRLKEGVSYEQICTIASRIDEFPGISWNSRPIRNYIFTPSMSHVIGYVGNITADELHILYNSGYTANSIIGKSGIEKEYDMLMKGKAGQKRNTVDVKGRNVTDSNDTTPPEPGKNLVLTIDRHIQELCEKALGERMGSVVVLKPDTGEILAMVSYPAYNPNLFYTNASSSYYKSISLDSRYPFLNRAIQSASAPASTFKTLMMTAILEEKAFPAEVRIDCPGSIILGDRTFNCHLKTGHGRLNLSDALKESCDVYFWEVGKEHLGTEKIVEYAKKMGLGTKTGIDLPGEVSGLVPTPQWKKRIYNVPWVGGDTYNMSIGQGYTQVTTLQIADMIAMIVNDGIIYIPHLLKEVRDPVTREILETRSPQVLHKADISKKTFAAVKKGMRRVVAEGSVRGVFNEKVAEVAAKTGTGEVGYKDKWTSWFASYGPYNGKPKDQVVVVVMVEASNDWEWWAPKAANAIYQGIFGQQNYEEVVETLDIWYLNQGHDYIRKKSE
ncbi:MAG: penicillin-binding protein 2 [Spirochaetia bacterium]|nr:penicillin-binding protein 2 [Spirochaetia bacterium]